MGPLQMLPLWVRVDLVVMAVKEFSTFLKALEMEPHHSELMNISLCWLANAGVSMSRSPENITCKLVLASSIVPSMSCLSYLDCFEMGGKWPYSCCFVGCCFQDLFKAPHTILVWFASTFSSMCFVRVHVVHLYSHIDKWRNSFYWFYFIG